MKRSLLLFLVVSFVSVAARAQFVLQGEPDGLSVTTFASGLNFPLGMAELPDGSVVVGVSNGPSFYGASSGRLVRLVDADADGVAEVQQTIVPTVPGASPTSVRRVGGFLFVTGQGQPIVIYQLGTDLSAPPSVVGQIDITYPSPWQHKHSGLLGLAGTSGQIELYFQVGSKQNFAATTDTAELTSDLGATGTLLGDSVYRLRLVDEGSGLAFVDLTQIADGLRNAPGLAFDPATGDLHIVDNGIDGLSDPNESHSADELNVIAAADVGGPVENFGFPGSYVEYHTGAIVGTGGIQPTMVFQPIPDPVTGDESEGPNEIAFAPPEFTASLAGSLFIGFHGLFSSGGATNDENPLVAVNVGLTSYEHLVGISEANVGHLDGLMSRGRDLFVADLATNGEMGAGGANQGAIYRIHFSGSNVAGTAGWRLLSAARSGMTVDDLAEINLVQGVPGYYPPPQAQPNLLTGYDGTAFSATGTGSPLVSGEGFYWYFYDLDVSPGGSSQSRALPTTLASNNGLVTTDTIVQLHAAGDGFNMLGNPFARGLDLGGIAAWPGSSNLNSTVAQIWNAAGSTFVTSVTNQVVSPWQGFFVEASTPGALSIPVSAQADGGVLQRSEGVETNIWFELAEAGGRRVDRATVLILGEGRDSGHDPGDATKLVPIDSAYVLLGFAPDATGALRAVESRPIAPAVLGMSVASVGASANLRLSWPRLSGLPTTWEVELRDLVTGDRVNLLVDSTYSFSVTPDAPISAFTLPSPVRAAVSRPRFELRFGPRTVEVEEAGEAELELFAPHPNPMSGQTMFGFALGRAGQTRLSVFDVQGREVAVLMDGYSIAGQNAAHFDASRFAPGVYVLRLRSGFGLKTQRIVVIR